MSRKEIKIIPEEKYFDKKYFDKNIERYIDNNYSTLKKIRPILTAEEIKKAMRTPKQPQYDNSNEDRPSSKPQPTVSDRERILAPLDEVFFDDSLMDDLIVRTSIPQLLEAKEPLYPGVILFGPPGTGKSEFQRAACKVYEQAGAYAKQVSTSSINSCFVGQFAKNLEEELMLAQKQGKQRGLPSLLCFDEGSTLAEQSNKGAHSVSKHYQEAIDTLKRYIGNESGSHLVLAISTNMLPEDFEEAMTREGRLTTFFIGFPSETQIWKMWKHFLKRYEVMDLTEEQVKELAVATPNTRGSFIEEFARGYITQRRNALLQARGYSNLREALKKGDTINDREVKKTIDYSTLKKDLSDYVTRINQRSENGQAENERTELGLHAALLKQR